MAEIPGSNLFAPYSSTVNVALTDSRNAVYGMVFVECAAASIPSGVAGYHTGCILMATDSGANQRHFRRSAAPYLGG